MKKITKVFATVGLAFLTATAASCGEQANLTLHAPSGAPGISVVDMQYTMADTYTVETGYAGTALKGELEKGEIDAIIAPFNVGVAAYNTTGYYQLGAVVTWGNLYLVSQNEFTLSDVTAENTILFGEKSIPGKITSYVLAQNGINTTGITYLSESSDTVAQLKKEENASKIYLVAEPALTAAKAAVKKDLGKTCTVISVQDEYKKITGFDTFPQAALFIRKETIANRKAEVDDLLAQIKASCEKTSTDTEAVCQKAVEKELFANATVLKNAMPKCAINYVSAKDAKAAIEASAAAILGGAKPADEFYYA